MYTDNFMYTIIKNLTMCEYYKVSVKVFYAYFLLCVLAVSVRKISKNPHNTETLPVKFMYKCHMLCTV